MSKSKHHDFREKNYHGILNHDGTVMVAKTYITATIKYIGKNNVLVKGNNKSYEADIHKDLIPSIQFVEIGDTGFIKWKAGKPYLVGYRKQNYDKTISEENEDKPVSENQNWIMFFKDMELGE